MSVFESIYICFTKIELKHFYTFTLLKKVWQKKHFYTFKKSVAKKHFYTFLHLKCRKTITL